MKVLTDTPSNYDRIIPEDVIVGGWKKVRKKILTALNIAAKEYEQLQELGLKSNRLFVEEEALISKFAEKLKFEKTSDLNNSMVAAVKTSSNLFIDENLASESEKQTIRFKMRILEEALNRRRELSKKMIHPIERNYAEAPLFSVSSPNVQTLVSLQDENGQLVQKRSGYRTVEYNSKSGKYLTSFDFKVFAGLQKLWEMKGRNKEFTFSFADIADTIEQTKEGGIYDLINTSIIKLSTTSIIMQDYKDIELKRRLNTTIHNLIQSAHISHEKKEITIIFNDYLHKGLTTNNIVRINLSIYQDLDSATSKLLYPLLSSLMVDRTEFFIDELIKTLGFGDLERSHCLKRIRQALEEFKDYRIIGDFIFKRLNRKIHSVTIFPSDELQDSLENGITVTTPIS
jgi:hypothetical protein